MAAVVFEKSFLLLLPPRSLSSGVCFYIFLQKTVRRGGNNVSDITLNK